MARTHVCLCTVREEHMLSHVQAMLPVTSASLIVCTFYLLGPSHTSWSVAPVPQQCRSFPQQGFRFWWPIWVTEGPSLTSRGSGPPVYDFLLPQHCISFNVCFQCVCPFSRPIRACFMQAVPAWTHVSVTNHTSGGLREDHSAVDPEGLKEILVPVTSERGQVLL